MSIDGNVEFKHKSISKHHLFLHIKLLLIYLVYFSTYIVLYLDYLKYTILNLDHTKYSNKYSKNQGT